MEITTIPGAVTVLVVTGELDANTFSGLTAEADRQLSAGNTRLLLDLTGVTYVSSAGLVALQSIAGRAGAAGGKSALCGVKPQVKRVLEIAGFDQMLTLFPDRAAALTEMSK